MNNIFCQSSKHVQKGSFAQTIAQQFKWEIFCYMFDDILNLFPGKINKR